MSKTLSLFLAAATILSAEQSLLEALKYATEHIPQDEWKNRLEKAKVDPGDHNIVDRYFLSYPVRKDLSLPALLAACEAATKKLPENSDLNKVCLLTIEEQLYEPHQAQWIANWVLEAYPNPEEAVAVSSPTPTNPTELSSAQVTVPSLTDVFGVSASGLPNACLNIAYLPYMDWIYFVSLQSPFSPPLSCSLEKEERSWGFLLAEPHYTFANVKFGHIHCRQHAPGISLVGGKRFLENWIVSGLFDYGRSSNHWSPESGYTKDTTNRWSFAPSLTHQCERAYAQATVLGMYDRSHIHNSLVEPDLSLSHWGFGARLDGAMHFDFSSANVRYTLAPYLRFDYFASFQDHLNSLNVVYVKNAQFFQAKGRLQFSTELHPTPLFCLIPQAYLGLSVANAFSRNAHPVSCDRLPSYPNWRSLDLGAEISFFYSPGLIAKAVVDISLCHFVQIYSGNVSIGWKW